MRQSGFLNVWLSVLMAGMLLCCTTPDSLDAGHYVQWVKDIDNGLHVQKVKDEFVFDLQYEPTEYVWLMRQDEPLRQPDKSVLDSIGSIQQFVLTVSIKNTHADFIDFGLQNVDQKQRKLYYFAYSFQNDIQLEEDGKILPCLLFHFEKPVDLKHSRTFILGFENPVKNTTATTLVINSEQFGALPIKIKVSKQDIPSLKI